MVVAGELQVAGRHGAALSLEAGRTFGMATVKPLAGIDFVVSARSDACVAAITAADLPRVAELFPVLNLRAQDTTMIAPLRPAKTEPTPPPTPPERPAAPSDLPTSIALAPGDVPLGPVPTDEAHHVLAAIAHSPIFCVLPPGKYDQLLQHIALARIGKGQTILAKGRPPAALFMVVSGRAGVVGESLVLGPGQCFGLICLAPSPAFGSTIVATTDCTLAVVTPQSLQILAARFPELELSDEESSLHLRLNAAAAPKGSLVAAHRPAAGGQNLARHGALALIVDSGNLLDDSHR
jgi:hypothetical protein